jgi:hypothetical protein
MVVCPGSGALPGGDRAGQLIARLVATGLADLRMRSTPLVATRPSPLQASLLSLIAALAGDRGPPQKTRYEHLLARLASNGLVTPARDHADSHTKEDR